MAQPTEGNPQQPVAAAPLRLLNLEERNDLRRRVISGEDLSLEDAKAVIDTIRQGRGAAALAAENKPARKGKAPKKAGLSDEAFNSSLDAAFGAAFGAAVKK